MGNMICCANDADGLVETIPDKKPKLFGAKFVVDDSSDEDDKGQENPVGGKLDYKTHPIIYQLKFV